MKYMTFNSSCSYAGLANLLSFYGVDTEDREIAMQMRLPYLFAREDGSYLAGPMLQGARWFNLYLRPLGFSLSERQMGREEFCTSFQAGSPVMLGLRFSPKSKHAVIFTDWRDGKYKFLNNKRKDSPEPETLCLTEKELLERLDKTVVVGQLERMEPARIDYRPDLEKSVRTLQSLMLEIVDFCITGQSIFALQKARDDLFRPILVDGVTMLELLGNAEAEMIGMLKTVRTQFLDVIRAGHSERLEDALDMPKLIGPMAYYEHLITERIKLE